MRRNRILLALVATLLIGCGEEPINQLPDGPVFDRDTMMPVDMMPADSPSDATTRPDSSRPDSGTPDSGTPDSGTPDSGTPDSGTPDTPADAGVDAPADSGTTDAPRDGGTIDSPTADAGFDAPRTDAFVPDAGTIDSPTVDAFVPDAGTIDSPTVDAFVPDAGTFDAPRIDASIPDAGTFDSGSGFDGGVTIPACPANTWCTETAPVAGKLLRDVWAVTENDVFAVGSGGTILRRLNNQPWVAMTSNTTSDLMGVWAASATDVWAVGLGGTIRRFDGSAWRAVTPPSAIDFDAIWGSGPNDVWISGFATVIHWNGTTFETRSLAGELFAISGTGPLDVWATGENAFVDHFTGTWTTAIKPDGSNSTFFAIHALSATNVFVSTFTPSRETLQWNGTTWTARPCKIGNSGCIFHGFYSTSATNLWGAGGAKVGHWNGTAWTAETPVGTAAALWSVSGAGSHVWVVGSDSLILHRN